MVIGFRASWHSSSGTSIFLGRNLQITLYIYYECIFPSNTLFVWLCVLLHTYTYLQCIKSFSGKHKRYKIQTQNTVGLLCALSDSPLACATIKAGRRYSLSMVKKFECAPRATTAEMLFFWNRVSGTDWLILPSYDTGVRPAKHCPYQNVTMELSRVTFSWD